MLPPTDPTEAESQAGRSPVEPAAGDRITFDESTSQHLEAALRVDDAVEKDYHVRLALQRVVIAEENRHE
ncbi:hypothetical protein [Haloplanus sp.]|uniref:hypothetical protein n=1 Tax=Haloplanus sp. TaxID=1961696 RepID=UPI002626E0AD|nr:hypothetical protein [Haloplanus sp.]